MTMTLKIEHVNGPQYQARISKPGHPDFVLVPGQSMDFHIHSNGGGLTITEEPYVAPVAETNATPGTLAEHVEKLQDAATDSADAVSQ